MTRKPLVSQIRPDGTERRVWVKLISRDAFRQYIEFRGETNMSLAKKAEVSKAIVGHLRGGQRSSCSGKTAGRIERALNAPPGSLFVAEVTNGSQGTSHAA